VRSRLRAAAPALMVVMVLGGSVAAADEQESPQSVTITVNAEARTVSVSGDAAITLPENTTSVQTAGGVTNTDATSRLTFNNPAGNPAAKIQVSRSGANLGGLTLEVRIPTGSGYSTTFAGWASAQGAARNLVTNITPGAGAKEDLILTWTAFGNTGSAGSLEFTATFVIMDN